MAAKEASRLSSKAERPAGRPEEESTAIAKLRELVPEPRVAGEDAEFGPRADPDASTAHEESDAAEHELERAADCIRPSWHGTEVPASLARPRAIGLPSPAAPFPAALPPPPALPMFEAFPIDQRAQYSADSTVRTAALLPERLAHLLNQPQIASASHWLRARPWLRAGLIACALAGLLMLLWPSSAPEARAPLAAQAGKSGSLQKPPPLPAPSAKPPLAAPSESKATAAPQNEAPPPVPSAKKRDKRAGRGAAKPLAGKAREARKPVKPSAPAR